jgi:hypothetical protein
MKNLVLAMLTIILLASSLVAHAVTIESSTSVYLTFRQCVSGETACDEVGPTLVNTIEGLPGSPDAQASQEDPDFGSAIGSARLTGTPKGSEHSGSAQSLPGTRNGSNSAMLQQYTNTGSRAVTVTFAGNLTYEQEVPERNTDIPVGSPGRSGTNAELGIILLNADTFEAGTTVEDNFQTLMEGPQGDVEITDLGSDSTGKLSNISESGTGFLSVTVTVNPGETIWLWAGMQSLAANGAVVTARFTTQLRATSAEETTVSE